MGIRSGYGTMSEGRYSGTTTVRSTAEKVLKNHGKNNSTGKFDDFVNKMHRLYKETLLDEDKLEQAMERDYKKMYESAPAGSAPMNEKMILDFESKKFDFREVEVNDEVQFPTKEMTEVPKIGEEFKVGPLTGTCVDSVKNGKYVYMKVTSNLYGGLKKAIYSFGVGQGSPEYDRLYQNPGESARSFDRRANDKYREDLIKKERPDDSKKVYMKIV